MENRRRQMQQFLTPQHPSMGINHWCDGEPQQFRTPQHPSSKTNYWGTVTGAWQFGTPQHPSWATNSLATFTGTRQFGTPATPQHPSSVRKNYWGTVDGTRQFGTPQHPGSFREFTTPQHPSLGTNNWGGASPMLSRNIPQESLEQRYEKLYTVRIGDEAFRPGEYEYECEDEDEDFSYVSKVEARKYESAPTSSRQGLFWKFIKRKSKTKNAKLGDHWSKKKKWLPKMKLVVKKRWPNGWI